MIKGKQCTIAWHVDDLKISHVKAKVVTDILNQLDQQYGQEIVEGKRAELSITRGKIHDYLGMTLDYAEKGAVKINMTEYIQKKCLNDLPLRMQGNATTPAAENLYVIDPNSKLLDKIRSEYFHSKVATLLFLAMRGRPNLLTAISFLCSRVKSPTEEDETKLSRALKYLNSTKDLILTLRAINLQMVKWWVDSSFAVHPDMRSHTGGVMSMGTGAIYSNSAKQKLNTKSSTESELVGANDILPQALWTKYFLSHQGYDTSTTVSQDNQSAIKLSENGKMSSGKRTRHINIRYYFITDQIKNGNIVVEYCPTENMVADFYTKPLQGKLFLKFRNQILGLAPMDDIYIHKDHRSVLRNTKNVTSEETNIKDPIKIGAKTKSSFLNNDVSWVEVVKRRHPQNRPRRK